MKYMYLESPSVMLSETEVTSSYNTIVTYPNNDELYIKDPSGVFEYDFCNGFRFKFKENLGIPYQITISDSKGNFIFNKVIIPQKDIIYAYSKVYFIDYKVTISRYYYCGSDLPPARIIKYNPDDQPITIFISYDNKRSGLGDTIAWMNAIIYFAEKYPKAKIEVVAANKLVEDFLMEYTNLKDYNIKFIDHFDAVNKPAYATYYVAYFNFAEFKDKRERYNYYKESNCFDGLLIAGLDILGIEGVDGYRSKSKLKLVGIEKKKPEKPYVCIGVNASSFYKKWLYKFGWDDIIIYLTSLGYDIYDIDQNRAEEHNFITTSTIPDDVIDDTGNKPLIERVQRLINAEFFIGLASGLSWVAWLCDIPIVMISGFSRPKSEFYTPYRVINYNVCNGCWNELNLNWTANACCPMYGDNMNEENFLICTFAIRAESVIKKINEIPSVNEKLEND